MTTLLLSRDSPSNTIVTHIDGSVAYNVKTDFKWKDRVTVITRPDEHEVARIEWKTFSEEILTMNGVTRPLSDLMPQSKKFMSSDRSFKNGAGEEFHWKIDGKLYCVAEATGLSVATYYRSSRGLVGHKKQASIDISEAVTDEQDLFVVTCLIMEHIRLYRESILKSGGGWYLTVNPP